MFANWYTRFGAEVEEESAIEESLTKATIKELILRKSAAEFQLKNINESEAEGDSQDQDSSNKHSIQEDEI